MGRLFQGHPQTVPPIRRDSHLIHFSQGSALNLLYINPKSPSTALFKDPPICGNSQKFLRCACRSFRAFRFGQYLTQPRVSLNLGREAHRYNYLDLQSAQNNGCDIPLLSTMTATKAADIRAKLQRQLAWKSLGMLGHSLSRPCDTTKAKRAQRPCGTTCGRSTFRRLRFRVKRDSGNDPSLPAMATQTWLMPHFLFS